MRTVGSRVPCNIVILYLPPILYYILHGRPLLRADVEMNLSPKFTKVFLTTHNLTFSQAISYLLPRLHLDYPIFNRYDFFGCFHYDYCNVDMKQLQIFQKVEYGGGPIFKVVLEC